ncbi:MAG: glycosyltransferase [Saprospiraceae bacterium]|nr:glycosyltransferase [Saprospiraceae bacterium]
MRKKIILTATTDLSYDQRMQRIAETLSTEYEVTLIGRLKKESIAFSENLPYKVVRLQTLFESGKGFYMIYNMRLFFYLIFKKADIITATDLDTLPACFLASRVKSVILGFDAHEWFTELPELINRPRIRNIWLKIERWFVPGADLAYTVNHSIANLYKSTFVKTFSVVRNMPLRNLHARVEPESNLRSAKIILYQGALNVGRGLESMITSMDQLHGFELHLAGEGDLSENLRKQVVSNQYPDRVVFHGYLLPEKLKQLTAKAWIGINLLENKSLNYYYSLANKFFDYVQAGIPQITMKFPEYELLNQENEVAILLDDLSVPGIVDAVNIVNVSSHYDKLKQNCYVASDKWCWENESKVLLKTYQQQFTQ